MCHKLLSFGGFFHSSNIKCCSSYFLVIFPLRRSLLLLSCFIGLFCVFQWLWFHLLVVWLCCLCGICCCCSLCVLCVFERFGFPGPLLRSGVGLLLPLPFREAFLICLVRSLRCVSIWFLSVLLLIKAP